MEYTEFLQCHKALNDIESNKQWKGSLYLPPCACHTSTSCTQSSITTQFDFTSFSDIEVPKLINLCNYIDSTCESFTEKSIVLCKKYSLHSLKETIVSASTQRNKVTLIKESNEYKLKKSYFKMTCVFYFHYLFPTLHLNPEIKTPLLSFKSLVPKKHMTIDVRTNLQQASHVIVKHQNHYINMKRVTFV